jgi:hypothetical protein
VRAVLERGEKRRRTGSGAVEDGGALPLYRGRGGVVAKREERPTLLGMKWLSFKWRLLRGTKRGGGGNEHGMRCRARGSDSMVGEALLCFSEGGGRRGQLGRVGQKAD